MLNNTYIFFGAILGLTIANVAGAATINMKNDRLSDLIQRVDYQRTNDSLEKSENQLLGRASWNVQCWVKSSEGWCIALRPPYSISNSRRYLRWLVFGSSTYCRVRLRRRISRHLAIILKL